MCGVQHVKMATSEERVGIDLLQPEILSKDCLLELFKQRCVLLDDVERMDRGALVELYYRCIIPLPQRTYRRNRRGQQMTKKQILLRKRTHSEISTEGNGTSHTSGPRLLSSYEPKAERLKPPPSAINFNHKVIKLGGQHTTPVAQKTRLASHSNSDSSFDFVINSKPRSTSSSSGDSSAHSSVSDSSCGESMQNNDRKPVCKTTPTVNVNIKLQRAVKLAPLEVTPMDVDEDIAGKCNNTKENDMGTATPGGNGLKVKSHRRSAVSLINKTLEAAADKRTPGYTAKTPTRTPSGDEPMPDGDGDLLHKKFRKIAVQWP